jgi:glycerate 2-kinase
MSAAFPAFASAAGRDLLQALFRAALKAVDPLQVVAAHLPARPKGRTVVIGAGKASARMALALESAWDGPLEGLVVTRYGHGEPCRRVRVVEAGHPMPDDAGVRAAGQIRALVQGLTRDDLVIALMSGGGSSLLAAPVEGLALADKQLVTSALLRCGATISEINCVRKHLSAVKGGKLAQSCGPAAVHTLVVSDVPGDDPAIVASGPTLPDGSLPEDAVAILRRHGIEPPPAVRQVLAQPPRGERPVAVGERHCTVVATAQMALEAAAAGAQALGLRPMILGNAIEGEARHVGSVLAGVARQAATSNQPAATPLVLLSGGETTVTVAGRGRGGRNAEYLLSHLIGVSDLDRVWGLAADTDGIDGSETNAGAVFGPDSWDRAAALGLKPRDLLADNDAYGFFEALGDLVVTGPTRTNVNDFRATVIL